MKKSRKIIIMGIHLSGEIPVFETHPVDSEIIKQIYIMLQSKVHLIVPFVSKLAVEKKVSESKFLIKLFSTLGFENSLFERIS